MSSDNPSYVQAIGFFFFGMLESYFFLSPRPIAGEKNYRKLDLRVNWVQGIWVPRIQTGTLSSGCVIRLNLLLSTRLYYIGTPLPLTIK